MANTQIRRFCTAVPVSGKICSQRNAAGECTGSPYCVWAEPEPRSVVPVPDLDVWSYGIAQGGTRTEVVNRVTEHLCNGWECVGGISVVQVAGGRVPRYLYSQAMRKFIHKGRGSV